MKEALKVALVGNPNTGKSTFFNAWTGLRQTVGNWPGVTVEKHTGLVTMQGGQEIEVVDLPGIYSLHAVSEDEKVAASFARFGQADVIVNIVDAVNLERNLYLTLALAELGRPMVVALSMTDVLNRRGAALNRGLLEERLGVPVVLTDLSRNGRVDLERAIGLALHTEQKPTLPQYPESIQLALTKVHREGEPFEKALHRLEGIEPGAEEVIEAFEKAQSVTPDVLIADARYAKIFELSNRVIRHALQGGKNLSALADRFILNRVLGVPIFLFIMYTLFWFTQVVGGCFIDFFDIAGGAIFVTGTEQLLTFLHAPSWLIQLLSGGLGTGIQTLATFIPPVFFIFLGLSILEDSGYMARAAYVMDRFMLTLGLPGSAFVPMLVGFGCTVPAIMATRTLSSRRDRFLTIFMAPFMSCGARLPVYALFGAAFFGARSGLMVFGVYMIGIVLAVLTGLLLKHTLFVGEPSPFVMELPIYHLPRGFSLIKQAWGRLSVFLFRAGKVLVLMVALLSILDHIKIHDPQAGDAADEDGEISLLNIGGRAMTPVFAPMGVEKDNWQASVALVVGLFAKEAVVGSLNTLYASEKAQDRTEAADGAAVTEGTDEAAEEAAEEEEAPSVLGELREAFASIPEAFAGLADTLLDPLGVSVIEGDEETVAAAVEADTSTLATLRAKFSGGPHQAFAYLLFILLYVPCLAAMAAVIKEVGWGYGLILGAYLTVLGWSVATLYYQLTLGHQAVWIIMPILLLSVVALLFAVLGRHKKVELVL